MHYSRIQLIEYSRKIRNEMQLMVCSLKLLDGLREESKREESKHGMIISTLFRSFVSTFFISSRSLIEFLYPQTIYKIDNDVTIKDYLDDKAYAEKLRPITPTLKIHRDYASKLFAHITSFNRSFLEDDDDFVDEIVIVCKEILCIYTEISESIPRFKLDKSFLNFLEELDLYCSDMDLLRYTTINEFGNRIMINDESLTTGFEKVTIEYQKWNPSDSFD